MNNMKKDVNELYKILQKKYPTPKTALEYNSPFQLLIAIVLSAQSKDIKVNEITKTLFKKYPFAKDIAELTVSAIENEIKTIGLYKNKAKYIKSIAEDVSKNGLTLDLNRLLSLPGVGKKTANVFINEIAPSNSIGIAVDTHVKRVSKRIGLTNEETPIKVENDLMQIFDKSQWRNISHYLIFIGRRYCGRNPQCRICPVNKYCDYFINSRK